LSTTDGLGVLAVDVDHFKHVNDFFGHASGDAVLAQLADRLRDATRTADEIVRMGGEEFLILLPGLRDGAALLDVAEAVRGAVSAQPVVDGSDCIPVTVSIGAALARHSGADGDELLKTADDALYAAKHAGRNRVHFAGTRHDGSDHADEQPHTLRLATTLAALAAVADDHGRDATAVSLLAARIARRLGASSAQVLRCRLAGLLADLGHLRLPPGMLSTPRPLSAQEWTLVREHPVYSQQLVAAVPELRGLSLIVRHHHERWDGHGYPDGLGGTTIPLEARILAAADCWHAITSDRPHRPALSLTDAHTELDRSTGTHLDPEVVTALRSVLLHRRDHDRTGEPLLPRVKSDETSPAPAALTSNAGRGAA
jgi:diguanylate cyclase (GGDEF)-like protein